MDSALETRDASPFTPARVLLLCAVTALAYLPALRGGFAWDDDMLVTRNRLIVSASGLPKLWLTTQSADYWPVTMTAFWVQWRLWGMHALGYHAVNLALHLGEALLLWRVLSRLGLRAAWFAAFLFAVHPLNVETVAWISELKNLAAMGFMLLAILAYLRWKVGGGRSEVGGRRSRAPGPGLPAHFNLPPPASHLLPWPPLWYFCSILLFAAAMLSKGSVAILPLILLGTIAWRRRLARRDFILILPFFLVAAVLAAVDIWFQRHGAHEVFRSAGVLARILGAGAVVWFYLGKALLPVNLSFVYPAWHVDPGALRWWIPLAAAVALTAVLWRWRRGWSRPLLFAWGYFCVCLAPGMGFTDVYFMKYSLVADRYAHLALIGVVAPVAWAWGKWGDTFRQAQGERVALGFGQAARWAGPAAAAIVVGLLAGLTWSQCGTFRDARTLFLATLRRNPHAWLADNYLGSTPPSLGTPEGIAYLQRAVAEKPDYAEAHYNLGVALAGQGGFAAARAQYGEAIRLDPHFAAAHNNLGTVFRLTGRPAEAVAEYRRALQLDPGLAQAHYNLGVVLADAGRRIDAIAQYRAALALDPGYVDAHNNLGSVLRDTGRAAEAIGQFQEVLRLAPESYAAENNLGSTLMAMPGRLPEAIAHFERAARLAPASAAIQANLGFALAGAGRYAEAIAHDEEALRLDPGFAAVRVNLGDALKREGR